MRRAGVVWGLLAAVASGGCIDSGVTPCGPDGLLCPPGKTCAVARGAPQCVLPAQTAACDGVAPGAACEFSGATGRCVDGVCLAMGCGNGVLDDGEVRDDGDTEPGDGCSTDCLSDETCGNGTVDFRERAVDAARGGLHTGGRERLPRLRPQGDT